MSAEPPADVERLKAARGASPTSCGRAVVLLASAVSWLGLLVQNVADLAEQYPWSPETAYPAIALVVFLVVWWVRPRIGAWLLLVWAALHLVGGALLSVLPVPLWPFVPDQSARHYAFHVLYGLTQLPLLVVAARSAGRSTSAPHPPS